jgi:hypothetical protein
MLIFRLLEELLFSTFEYCHVFDSMQGYMNVFVCR